KLHRKLSRVKSGKVHKLSFSDRAMRCDCGWVCDRDLNAALVVLKKGLELSEQYFVGLDRPEVKLLEKGAAARMDIGLKPTYSCELASMKEEAHSLKRMGEGHHVGGETMTIRAKAYSEGICERLSHEEIEL
ncbi:MAG: hypothetical protein DRP33_03155, partial [Thermotogae bacterium]